MARAATIKVIRTTRANLNAQATANNLVAGEPYLITDEKRMAIGLSSSTYSASTISYSTNIGDGTTTAFTITHNLNTLDVIAQVKDSSGNVAIADIVTATVNTITVTFKTAPTTNQYRVTVIG